MVIALTGCMGSGKSSVGRALSELLCSPFVDLDEYIVAKAGRSIAEIFDGEGEAGFRALESEALEEVLSMAGTDLVLSLGGGTICSEANAGLIAQTCRCVYLRASANVLSERLRQEPGQRPLLRSSSLDGILAERAPLYERAADMVVDTDGRTPEQVAHEIAAII